MSEAYCLTVPSLKRFVLANIATLIISLLFVLVAVSDSRFGNIGEPSGDQLDAISIGISQEVYGTKGFIGLLEVRNSLNNINYDSEVGPYSAKVTIQKSVNLKVKNLDDTHGFTNDSGYLLFVIAAFKIFGVSLQSLVYFWGLIFLLSAILFQVLYRNKTNRLIILNAITISQTLVLFAFPGSGIQLNGITGIRGMTLLGVVPTIAIAMGFLKPSKSKLDWIVLLFFSIVLSFVVSFRASTLYMPLYLLSIVFWRLVIYSVRLQKTDQLHSKIVSMLMIAIILFPIFGVRNLVSHVSMQNSSKHVTWMSALIPLASNPKLYQKYFCSNYEEPAANQDLYIPTLPCHNKNIGSPGYFDTWLDDPADVSGYRAVLRYENQENLSDSFVLPRFQNDPSRFSIDWNLFDSRARIVYLQIWRNDPTDAILTLVLSNPVRYVINISKYPIYTMRGLFGSTNLVWELTIFFAMLLLFKIQIRSRNIYEYLKNFRPQLKLRKIHIFLNRSNLQKLTAATVLFVFVFIMSSILMSTLLNFFERVLRKLPIDSRIQESLTNEIAGQLPLINVLIAISILMIISTFYYIYNGLTIQISSYLLPRACETRLRQGRVITRLPLLRLMLRTKLNCDYRFMLGIALGLWAFSLTQSIFFYSLYHTIPDSVTLIYTILFLLVAGIYQKNVKKSHSEVQTLERLSNEKA